MKRIAKLTVIMTAIGLSSCGSTCPKPNFPQLEPIDRVTFNLPELNCLSRNLKIIVVDRIENCESRMDTLRGQIRAYNGQKNAAQ